MTLRTVDVSLFHRHSANKGGGCRKLCYIDGDLCGAGRNEHYDGATLGDMLSFIFFVFVKVYFKSHLKRNIRIYKFGSSNLVTLSTQHTFIWNNVVYYVLGDL